MPAAIKPACGKAHSGHYGKHGLRFRVESRYPLWFSGVRELLPDFLKGLPEFMANSSLWTPHRAQHRCCQSSYRVVARGLQAPPSKWRSVLVWFRISTRILDGIPHNVACPRGRDYRAYRIPGVNRPMATTKTAPDCKRLVVGHRPHRRITLFGGIWTIPRGVAKRS